MHMYQMKCPESEDSTNGLISTALENMQLSVLVSLALCKADVEGTLVCFPVLQLGLMEQTLACLTHQLNSY